uniref:Uncharacterized protein n=1 Tax=Rhizophora mucronata TaxID=61149 RepID=A0A2P2PDY0_RHIMU
MDFSFYLFLMFCWNVIGTMLRLYKFTFICILDVLMFFLCEICC